MNELKRKLFIKRYEAANRAKKIWNFPNLVGVNYNLEDSAEFIEQHPGYPHNCSLSNNEFVLDFNERLRQYSLEDTSTLVLLPVSSEFLYSRAFRKCMLNNFYEVTQEKKDHQKTYRFELAEGYDMFSDIRILGVNDPNAKVSIWINGAIITGIRVPNWKKIVKKMLGEYSPLLQSLETYLHGNNCWLFPDFDGNNFLVKNAMISIFIIVTTCSKEENISCQFTGWALDIVLRRYALTGRRYYVHHLPSLKSFMVNDKIFSYDQLGFNPNKPYLETPDNSISYYSSSESGIHL